MFHSANLIDEAKIQWERAYAPYSKFQVGAAILSRSGRIYSGCNVENASYGLTICAERSAIFKAISENDRDWECLVIYAAGAPSPCGACRQCLAEFCPELTIVSVDAVDGKRNFRWQLSELLPAQFRL